MSDSWKLAIPCTRAEAEAVSAWLDRAELEDAPSIVISETANSAEPEKSDSWQIEAYFPAKPKKADLKGIAAALPRLEGKLPKPTKLDSENWVELSQQGLEPISAGRFHVHTPEMPASDDPAMINLEIGAGMAFGTGHHETTQGCIAMLDGMRSKGVRATSMLDLGTGTGLLAMAALHLWPRAYATASDIDPLCGPVVAENAERNGFRLGQKPGELAMFIADGLDDADLARRSPYDLVIANILALPLIELAPDIAAVTSVQGEVVLAGLLNQQADAVLLAYKRNGFLLLERHILGDWSILRLRRRGSRWTGAKRA